MGSSGGGSDQAYYANLEKLYGEQANSAALLRGLAEKNLPGATNAYMSAVNDVTLPGYADRQAALAGADMVQANAHERAATNRDLMSMGVNPNDQRFVSTNRATDINNASRFAAAKNIARNDANKYKLAVAQDAVGTFTGQSNSAAQQAGQASSGLASLYQTDLNQKNANNQQTANNIGSAIGGGLALYSMFNEGGKAGKLSALRKSPIVERHMLGGFAGSQQTGQQAGFFPMQQVTPPPQQQQPAQPQQTPLQSGVRTYKNISQLADIGKGIARGKQAADAGAAMTGEEAKAASEAYRAAAENAGSLKDATQYNQVADKIESGWLEANPGAEQLPAPVEEAVMQQTGEAAAGQAAEQTAGQAAGQAAGQTAGQTATTTIGDSALTTAATETATTEATAAAATETAASAAGSSALSSGLGAAMSAIGTAMPWIGAAYAVGSLLGAWKDGGKAGEAQDFRDVAGKVPGKWDGNVDDVPALLVKGEGILNAEATKLIGDKGLRALNNAGMEERKKGKSPSEIKTVGLAQLS